MLYLIGGASRTGKSTLSRLASEKTNINYIELDLIRNELSGKPKDPYDRAIWFYPYLEKVIEENIHLTADLILEGDEFYPEQIVVLSKKFPIKACFLGSSKINAPMLRNIDGWHQYKTDAELEELATMIRDRSEVFRKESLKHNFKYIDVEKHDKEKLHEAYVHLFEQ